MDKISKILPPSRRVTAIDTESSPAVRPGAPTYGRRARDVSAAGSKINRASNLMPSPLQDFSKAPLEPDRISLSRSAVDRVNELKRTASPEETSSIQESPSTKLDGGSVTYRNPKEASKARLISELNKNFFSTPKSAPMEPSEEILEHLEEAELGGI